MLWAATVVEGAVSAWLGMVSVLLGVGVKGGLWLLHAVRLGRGHRQCAE